MANTNLTSMTVSLPEAQKAYVKEQAARTGCSTPSEYIRRLIHEDERRRAGEALEAKLLEGLAGDVTEMTAEDWAVIRAEALSRLEKRRKSG